MGILSENNNQNELEQDEQEYPDTFLQDEFLMLNHDLKEKIRDLLNDKKLKLDPKDLQILIQTLKESYDFDYRLKERIFNKQWDYDKRKICKELNVKYYELKDTWNDELKDKKDY
jgi:hypothetical protein